MPIHNGKNVYEMNSGYANDLDCIRRSRGNDACKYAFRRLAKERRQTAIQSINDDRLFFASLFVLQQDIAEFGLMQELSERNQIALELCERILASKKPDGDLIHPIPINNEKVHIVLLWMFNTGAADDGLSDNFDLILDTSASILIKTHHEKVILHTVAELIFKRNRNGSFNHDLIWAFFQARDSKSLQLIAEYLRSRSPKDVELAHTLLHLPENAGANSGGIRQYNDYMRWLNENGSYIYFTGESFQLTNNPSPCALNLEAKYLCKESSPKRREFVDPFTEEERSYLNNFNEAQEEAKEVLADYSNKLYRQDPPHWNQWIQSPIDQQIQVAKYGRRDFV